MCRFFRRLRQSRQNYCYNGNAYNPYSQKIANQRQMQNTQSQQMVNSNQMQNTRPTSVAATSTSPQNVSIFTPSTQTAATQKTPENIVFENDLPNTSKTSANAIYNSNNELTSKGTILRTLAGSSEKILQQATQQGAQQGATTGAYIGQIKGEQIGRQIGMSRAPLAWNRNNPNCLAAQIGARKGKEQGYAQGYNQGYQQGAQQGALTGRAINACIDVAGGKKVDLNDIPDYQIAQGNGKTKSLRQLVKEHQAKETTSEDEKFELALNIAEGIKQKMTEASKKAYLENGLVPPEAKIPQELVQLEQGLKDLQQMPDALAKNLTHLKPDQLKEQLAKLQKITEIENFAETSEKLQNLLKKG